MKYNIELTGEQLAFIHQVLMNAPLPARESLPVITSIELQAKAQSEAYAAAQQSAQE
jgi:hypothetical protein